MDICPLDVFPHLTQPMVKELDQLHNSGMALGLSHKASMWMYTFLIFDNRFFKNLFNFLIWK